MPLLVVLLLLGAGRAAQAQLANSFYNVTGIDTRVLPNAVQVTIKTDGTVKFGGDLNEFIAFDKGFQPKALTSFRIRLVNARARLPAFVDLNKDGANSSYPADAAVVTLGREPLGRPFFGGASGQEEPRVDIELRFFVPVTVQRFVVDRSSSGDGDEYDNGIDFKEFLGPLEVGVELGRDRRSIVVTIITDRTDSSAVKRLNRSPAAGHKHRLRVTPATPSSSLVPTAAPDDAQVSLDPPELLARTLKPSLALLKEVAPELRDLSSDLRHLSGDLKRSPNHFGASFSDVAQSSGDAAPPSDAALPDASVPGTSRLRIDVLHTPLSQVLDEVAAAAKLPLTTRADAADVDISLLLPEATPDEFLRVLATAYGLVITPRSPEEGGGFAVGRSGPFTVTERLPLRYLSPERARLLFPDFLLPSLRIDRENNALLVSGSPELAARLRRDLALLDLPRPQVRVEVSLWEMASTQDLNYALRLTRTLSRESESISAGEVTVRLQNDQTRAFRIALDSLKTQGRARLRAQPFLLVASGEQGTLFLGQTRFVTVLQPGRFGGQEARALSLQVGYSLSVLPRVGAEGDITLELNPRASTVDEVETGTGLPTLGIRETSSVVRVRSGETVVMAGLNSDLDFSTRRRLPLLGRLPVASTLFNSRRKNRAQTELLLLVSAKIV